MSMDFSKDVKGFRFCHSRMLLSGIQIKKGISIYWIPDQAGHDQRGTSFTNIYTP